MSVFFIFVFLHPGISENRLWNKPIHFYLALLRKQGTWHGDTGSIHYFTSRKSLLRATYDWAQVRIIIKHTIWKWHVSPFSDVPQNFCNNFNDNPMPFLHYIMQYYRVSWFSKNTQNIFPTTPLRIFGHAYRYMTACVIFFFFFRLLSWVLLERN